MLKQVVHIINGPNLNMLGKREPEKYGNITLDGLYEMILQFLKSHGYYEFHTTKTSHKFPIRHFRKNHNLILDFHFYQTNSESELIGYIQNLYDDSQNSTRELNLIINPAAYGHTSIALRDSLLAVNAKFIEVHISNIYARESFRHFSYLSDIADGVIIGLGLNGYILALDNYLSAHESQQDSTIQLTVI